MITRAMTPKILVFAGSIRSGSFNVSLAAAAAKEFALLGADVTRISLADYPLPIMDEDLQKANGVPENAVKLARIIAAHDAVFIASPEYNASIPPLLKNTVDWVSRVSRDGDKPLRAWKGRIVAFGSASEGRFAAARGLYHLRAVLMAVGAEIISAQCSISGASTAFGEDGSLVDERSAKALTSTCRGLIDRAKLSLPD